MSIFNDIRTTLETKIDGMTTGGGYNYDYDNVNEYCPSLKTYPNVLVTFPDEVDRGVPANVINSYSTMVEIHFKITVDDTTSDVNEALDNVLEDFKRLMEEEHNDLQAQGMEQSDFVDSSKAYTNVRGRPGIITIKFNIKYRVRRNNPSLTT